MTNVRIFRFASNYAVKFPGHNYKVTSDNLNVNPVDNVLRIERACWFGSMKLRKI